METLASPKTSYLLETGLDVLHSESREWLSELEFLKSDLRFFMKLLKSTAFESGKEQQRQHIFENMDKLASAITAELETEVKSHEKNLAALLANKNRDDASYRSKHIQLKERIERINNDVRTLKMLVFDFEKHLK
ncbi:MAG TPA: hypothetical protein VNJ07_08025 [Chitinophagales bacterium]|nr:hypothetical protein [Chitinophagales bacterium]